MWLCKPLECWMCWGALENFSTGGLVLGRTCISTALQCDGCARGYVLSTQQLCNMWAGVPESDEAGERESGRAGGREGGRELSWQHGALTVSQQAVHPEHVCPVSNRDQNSCPKPAKPIPQPGPLEATPPPSQNPMMRKGSFSTNHVKASPPPLNPEACTVAPACQMLMPQHP